MSSATFISISELTIATEFQMREKLSTAIVAEYAQLILDNKGEWPFRDPCSVVRVKDLLILTDGFHRVAAVRKAGEDHVQVIIADGTRLDAMKAAFTANQYHGLRLTNADKRHKVTIALNDSTLSKWSDRKLSELCGVSDPFVASVRAELQTVSSSAPENTEKSISADGAQRPSTKADAEMQRKKIVAAVITDGDKSDREIAKAVGCDGKTVASVRRELATESEPESAAIAVAVEDEPDEPRDLLDMFEDMKQIIREAMHEFPQAQRAITWKQLVEHLSVEDMQQW